jgi:hypothetical protein
VASDHLLNWAALIPFAALLAAYGPTIVSRVGKYHRGRRRFRANERMGGAYWAAVRLRSRGIRGEMLEQEVVRRARCSKDVARRAIDLAEVGYEPLRR